MDLDLAAFISYKQRNNRMPRFRLQEPNRITDEHLLQLLFRRCERLATYSARMENGELAPEVLQEAERKLIDKAAGEWCHRRGIHKPVHNAVWATLGEADVQSFERRYDYVVAKGNALPPEERTMRLTYVKIAQRIRAFINMVNECNARGYEA